MRATSLKPYLYKEKNIIHTYDEHSLYIQNILIYTIYKDKSICPLCNINCCNINYYLSKYSSKIKCNVFVYYKFHCNTRLNFYTIQLDGKMIKD